MTDTVPPLPPPPDSDMRTGPPWEHPGPPFSRFVDTTREVLLNPTPFFRTMRREGGLGAPLAFGIIGTLLGGIVGALYHFMLSSMTGGLADPETMRDNAVVGLFSTGCVIVIVPIAAVLSIFIGSAIYHVMLMMLGAARRPFETTMRVVAYAMGATSVLQLLPFCGAILAAVWSIVVNIIGLAQAHEIPTGKAAAAVLIPVVLCCVLVALFYAALLALLLGGVVAGWQQ